MKAIINTKLIMEDGIIFDGVLLFEKDKIVDVGERDKIVIPENAEIIDAKGKYTAPGFVDIHNHGSEKYLFVDEPKKCAEHFLSHGETTVLPTLYSNLTLEKMLDGAKKIKQASKDGDGRIIDGLYMEGPYMGVFGSNQKYILWGGDIKEEEYKPLVDNLFKDVRVWAIDPSRANIEKFMDYAKDKNPEVKFAMGHSHATFADCKKLSGYNLTIQTHHQDSGKASGNAQGTVGAGCDEYALYNPEVYTELICDYSAVHVDPDMMKLSIKIKGTEKVVLITDSMPKSGDYKNNEKEGIMYGPDLNYDYEGHLAGSHLTLDNAVKNVMRHTGYGLCHAVRFATINPAKAIGIDGKVGSLKKGKLANLIIMDDAVNIEKVILLGETVR